MFRYGCTYLELSFLNLSWCTRSWFGRLLYIPSAIIIVARMVIGNEQDIIFQWNGWNPTAYFYYLTQILLLMLFFFLAKQASCLVPHCAPVIHIKVKYMTKDIRRCFNGIVLASSCCSIRLSSRLYTSHPLTVKHLGSETLTHLLYRSSSNTLSNIPQSVLVGFVDFRLNLFMYYYMFMCIIFSLHVMPRSILC